MMKITNENGKSYTLSESEINENKIFIWNGEGVGKSFDAHIISDIIFEAIDKFYRENYNDNA